MYKSLQKAIDLMDGFCWRAAIDVSVPTSADFAERGKQRRLTVDNVRETWQESCLGHGHCGASQHKKHSTIRAHEPSFDLT
jgi:hypothetical protein